MTYGTELMPLLTVVSAPSYGTSFRLRPGRWLIGRSEDADILLGDRRVSRQHAVVESADGRITLTDLGSTNGTWVNERRVTGSVELTDGDRIRIAAVDLRYFDLGSAPTDPIGTFRPALARLTAGATPALSAPTGSNVPAQTGAPGPAGIGPEPLAAPVGPLGVPR
ncbi:MAG TPA: FHA domain-containing protein [Micromonospora sp.]